MPRIRTIKPDFFTSPDTAKADFPTRIFYAAMWCWADDFGVGETNLNGLLGHAFPDSDEFSAQDVRQFCANVAQHFGVTFYTVRGRHYFAIPSWEKHQKTERREDRRKHPAPSDPDALPDLRFQPGADSAPDVARGIGAESALEREGEQGKGTEEPPYPPSDETSPDLLPLRKTGTEIARQQFARIPARSQAAHHIAQAFSNSLPNPIEAGVVAKIGVEVDKCLQSDINPHAIADGMKLWAASDSWSPSQIPTFVAKATARAAPNGIGKPTKKALDYDTAAAELLAELDAR